MVLRRLCSLAIATVLIATAGPAFATAGDTLWTKTYDGGGTRLDSVAGVGVDTTIPYLVFAVGTSVGAGTRSDIVTIAFDAYTGDEVWARRYDGPVHGADRAVAIAVDSNYHTVVVTGRSESTAGTGIADVVTIAYHATDGLQEWQDRFSMSSHSSDTPAGVVVSSGSTFVLVAGTEHGGIVSYDSTGNRVWHRTVTDRSLAGLIGIEEIGGYLFAVGSTFSATGPGYGFFTAGYRALDGSLVWTKRYDGPSGYALATDASAGGTTLYVTGIIDGTPTNRITTIGYEPHDGTRFWLRTIAPKAPSNGVSYPHVAATQDGSRIAVAVSSYLDGIPTYLTRSYGSDGSTLWTARENSADDAGTVADVVIDGSGRVYVTGKGTTTGAAWGSLTVAYAPTGAPAAWKATPAPMANGDSGNALVVDQGGYPVFVGSRWNRDIRVDAYATA